MRATEDDPRFEHQRIVTLLHFSTTCRGLRSGVLRILFGRLTVPSAQSSWFLALRDHAPFLPTHTISLAIPLGGQIQAYFVTIAHALPNLVTASLSTYVEHFADQHETYMVAADTFLHGIVTLTLNLTRLERLAIIMTLPESARPFDLAPLRGMRPAVLRQLLLSISGRSLVSTSPFQLPAYVQELATGTPLFELYFGLAPPDSGPELRYLRIQDDSPWIFGSHDTTVNIVQPSVSPNFRAALSHVGTMSRLTVLVLSGMVLSNDILSPLRELHDLSRCDIYPVCWSEWPLQGIPPQDPDADPEDAAPSVSSDNATAAPNRSNDARMALSPWEEECVLVFMRQVVPSMRSLQVLHIGGAHSLVRNPTRARSFWNEIWSAAACNTELIMVGLGKCVSANSTHRHIAPCDACRSEDGFKGECYGMDRFTNTPLGLWQYARALCEGHFQQMCAPCRSPFHWVYENHILPRRMVPSIRNMRVEQWWEGLT